MYGMYPQARAYKAPEKNEDGDRPTWPPPGTASLQIREELELLFISSVRVMRARVDGIPLWESQSSSRDFSKGFKRQWARACIRANYVKLRELGVNAEEEYVRWGGKSEELTR